MANKLRDVFNNDEIYAKGKISFKDIESSRQFQEALKKVYETGESVKLDGEAAMSIGVNAGASILPFEDYERITNIVVGPSPEKIEITLEIDGEKKQVPLDIYLLNDGCIIQTPHDHFIFTKMILHPAAKTAKINITPHYENASNTLDVLNAIKQIQALIKALFVDDKNGSNAGLKTIKDQLKGIYDIYEQLYYVEEKFSVSFVPKDIDLKDEDSLRDLFELCLAVRDGMAIRLDAKLTSTESTGVIVDPDHEIKENEPISLTFLGGIEYHLWGKEIKLHTANLLCNALIKNIEIHEDEKIRVTYGDVESNPMYISYKGFMTEDEARDELKQVLDRKEEYENAKTAIQYYNEMGSMAPNNDNKT